MGRIVRWSFLFLAALVLTAVFEPPLMDLFRSWGWHEQPEQIPGDVLNWLSGIVGGAAFPWVAGGVLGASMGSWLHYLATRLDNKRPSKPDQFASLSSMIHNVQNELFEGAKSNTGEVDFNGRNRQSDQRIKALYAELRPLGLRPPNYDKDSNQEYNVGHYSYLQTLEPFADRGNLAEAKRQEKLAKAEFTAASRKPQLPPETGS
jgi:hypothetical protein